jgi:hypothetical protein
MRTDSRLEDYQKKRAAVSRLLPGVRQQGHASLAPCQVQAIVRQHYEPPGATVVRMELMELPRFGGQI